MKIVSGLVTLTLSCLLMTAILNASTPSLIVKAQRVSVNLGDSFVYGKPDGSPWVSIYPSNELYLSYMEKFANYSALSFSIINDSIPNSPSEPGYTFNQTLTFRNGTTPLSQIGTVDLYNGSGIGSTFFISPGLQAGDYVYPGAAKLGNFTWYINATRTYMPNWPGRTVCILNCTTYTPYQYWNNLVATKITIYWDQSTGVLLEFNEEVSGFDQSKETAFEGILSYELIANNVGIPMHYATQITINPDGSISPSYANITTSDNVTYTFTDNNDLPIVVNRSNIIINGMSHSLQASGGNGLSLTNVNNVTVKNTTIMNSYCGICLNSSSSNFLSGNNIRANSFGIILETSSDHNTLNDNYLTANSGGIGLISSDNNTLSSNNATANSEFGIVLAFSSGNILSGNTMANSTDNFGVLEFPSFDNHTVALSDFENHIDTSNLVNGKPIYYLMNQSNIMISPENYLGIGYLALINCNNATVQDLTLTRNYQGLLLANTTNSRIITSNVTADYDGIDLYSSSENTLSGNNMTADNEFGVFLLNSSSNVLSGNEAKADGQDGIWLGDSSDNTLSNNSVTENSGIGGTFLSHSSNNTLVENSFTANNGEGVDLWNSSENTLARNDFSANGNDGIYLELSSDNNTLTGNKATANIEDGIDLYSSSGNILTGNNFTANGGTGISLEYSSSGNVLSGNNATNNGVLGIALDDSSNNTLNGNNIVANTYDGVDLDSSYSNVLSGNDIAANYRDGIALSSSSGNVLSNNNVNANSIGIWLMSSSANRIFHNNFINNTQQVTSDGSPNTWDNSYPSGGNYWSDYRTAYPSAVENDSSAIWNTPYVIDSNNTDNYPLMGMYYEFFPAFFSNKTVSVTVISNSTVSNLIVSIYLSVGGVLQPGQTFILFTSSGQNGSTVFCRIMIPKRGSLNTTSFAVYINSDHVNATELPFSNSTYAYLYFTYTLPAQQARTSVIITVPEFQPYMLLPLFMIITLLGAIIFKKRTTRTR